ncbi:paeninodin family lasso peptide [Jeotgalibacillus sp. ET6]|nr:paeninodin family lasso peptide [Jeotgalibacillus sp. ET6]MDG5472619.1 paeninodin family lasso peptide [Jeotgalibacillus sp. ET6]
MKKEWKKPEVELLTVQMTMLGEDGDFLDNDFPDGTPRGDLTFS